MLRIALMLAGIVLSWVAVASASQGGSGDAKMEIGTNFWDVGWGGGKNDPFRDGFRDVTGENPWKPEFLEEVKVYTVFRFMDWAKTNNAVKEHKGGTKWSQRRKKSDKLQRPMAWEWMIDLCNRTKRDMWVCVPHFADEEYMFELGKLIARELDPSLKCYVEWSNETWNGMFRQAHYCVAQGRKLDLPAGTRWEDNEWYRGQMYHAMRTFETFHQFERAFKGQTDRLVRVIGGTPAHAFARTHIWAIDQPFLNPHKVKPDAYSIAPYYGNGKDGKSRNLDADVKAAMDKRLKDVKRVGEYVRKAGLAYYTYEGGQHFKKNADAYCANPRIYDDYLTYLDRLDDQMDLFMHYTHNGTWGRTNAWGAKAQIGQPMDKAHKFRALYDYAVKAGQYDPKTGEVERIAEQTNKTTRNQ